MRCIRCWPRWCVKSRRVATCFSKKLIEAKQRCSTYDKEFYEGLKFSHQLFANDTIVFREAS